MTKIKICGLTTLEDARYCAGAGADYLGFVQHPPSPRYVIPEIARQIIAWVYGPEAVGVFVDVPADTVNQTADATGFTLVQLHGTETPAYCDDIDRPIIKALRVEPDHTPDDLRRTMDRYGDRVAYFLLDTHVQGLPGGTGRVFNWELARALVADYPLFLAGGIGAHNVAEAIRTVQPYALDLSSSVESAPGVKDFDQLTAFFDAVQAAQEA